ncbi:succinate dehydrogenase iron-sulfur subunit [Candidatus Legionella polyplacis]|uniref:Succinate dehydrogenase iron-sulfur subunit n=1 Tax=Candidatus Legionella polyplacis TaxID=2005262 RepID=A0ABZ2GWS9_9GAMM
MSNFKKIYLSIYRYYPDKDNKPHMKNYIVNVPYDKDIMLLSVLEKIKLEQDSTLAFRRSCREGVCGSDAININGKNVLSCVTKVFSIKSKKLILRPLPGFPVIRDLVVDLSIFYKQYERIRPYLLNKQKKMFHSEYRQSQDDRKKLNGSYECILCACCSSSCPSYWWNPDKFIGPAALVQAYRFIVDSRDTEKLDRLYKLRDPFSVFRCRSIMNCTTVCPKNINITEIISKIRLKLLKMFF